MRSAVADVVHLLRIDVHAALGVAHDGVVLPRAFPQLVEHLEVLVGMVVPGVVVELIGVTEVPGRGRQVTRHDVPPDPSPGEVVEGGESARERIRMLESRPRGDAEAEVLGDRCHGRDQQQRIRDRDLGALPQRGLIGSAVDVVGAEHVRDEQAVEQPAFEEPGEVGPVAEVGVAVRLVRRVPPQSRRLVGDAVHVEGVETDLPGHAGAPASRTLCRCPALQAYGNGSPFRTYAPTDCCL